MPSGPSAIIQLEPHGEALLLTVASGQLTNLNAIDRFDHKMKELSQSRAERNWVLNFCDVTFIVTPAINTILVIMKRLRAKGGDLVLTGLNRDIRHIFELMRLDEVLTIAADVTAALEALEAAGDR